MKKILITGAGSFVGLSFEKYLGEYGNSYSVDTLDMLDSAWREYDFSSYDTVFHVAGIAHSDAGAISKEREKLYYAVNTELTAEVATKAKADGARQFIFMSSSIVYGAAAPIGKSRCITRDTKPDPENCYGKSKLMAEERILPLDDGDFRVAVLRPPMIYGKGCKGNFVSLEKMARRLPIFPFIRNERSVLYIDNLCELVRLLIENGEGGIFHPQNSEYTCTSEMVRTIARTQGRRVLLLRGFGPLLRFVGLFTSMVNKAFGSFTYGKELSEYKCEYCKYGFEESIKEIYGIR